MGFLGLKRTKWLGYSCFFLGLFMAGHFVVLLESFFFFSTSTRGPGFKSPISAKLVVFHFYKSLVVAVILHKLPA